MSYDEVKKIPHISVALPTVQDKRDVKTVPNGLKLHQYANLYFDARNPMMYRRKEQAEHLCVLKMKLEVLNHPDVVVSDQNAASDYAAFYDSATGVSLINFDLVFQRNWTSANQIEHWRNSAAKCAEILVPERVESECIMAIAVASEDVKKTVQNLGIDLPVYVEPDLFFRG